ncbi:MAG: VPLPA-CTERM sorting domain-containing protein [Gammaproteobacteria bacterium]|nr:VPLPA-CTERM sorting domain-containing protein [Gammaproteobacteria bacterium]
MKKLITFSLLLLSGYSALSSANTVEVTVADGLFAGNSAGALTTVTALSNSEIAANLNDYNNGTFVFGSSNNGTITATLTMNFVDTVSNQAGTDIDFYFMGPVDTSRSMHICFTTNCNPLDTAILQSTLIPDISVDLGETDSAGISILYAISVIEIDLSDYGFTPDEILGNFSIDLVAGDYNKLIGIDSLNSVSAIPVPAAIWLLLSGIGFLSAFSNRRHK